LHQKRARKTQKRKKSGKKNEKLRLGPISGGWMFEIGSMDGLFKMDGWVV
jgi:hypothetical protein